MELVIFSDNSEFRLVFSMRVRSMILPTETSPETSSVSLKSLPKTCETTGARNRYGCASPLCEEKNGRRVTWKHERALNVACREYSRFPPHKVVEISGFPLARATRIGPTPNPSLLNSTLNLLFSICPLSPCERGPLRTVRRHGWSQVETLDVPQETRTTAKQTLEG